MRGAYIGHSMHENTIKPNNLAKFRDKGVIHQILIRLPLITKGAARQCISLRLKDFPRQRKFR